METGSYLLVGTDRAVRDTFGSTMHGLENNVPRSSEENGSRRAAAAANEKARHFGQGRVDVGLAEEAGLAYKNISEVVKSVDRAGITKKVLNCVPLAI